MAFIELSVFAAIAVLSLVFSMLVFAAKKLLHAVLALTSVFALSAALFALLGQELVALLQLFIFVGGLSLYLMVTIAAEYRGSEYTRLSYIPIIAIVVAAAMLLPMAGIFYVQQQSNSFLSAASAGFSNYYAILYFIATMLFAVGIGSILVLKRLVRLVV
ncbi:MAG: hypothetical protein ACP5K9_02695 [Candidatus Micrarchaeia archaeon]